MFGCEALNASTTFFSTAVCSGASPPPMQQNQRISTGPPGGTVAGPVLAGGADVATATDDGDAPTDAGGVAVEPPQALTSRANATSSTPDRNGCRAVMSSPPPVRTAGQPVGAVVVDGAARGSGRAAGRRAAGGAAPASAVFGSASQLARTTTRST